MTLTITELLQEIFETKKILENRIKNQSIDILDDFSFSEMHAIQAIYDIKDANVTKLAGKLNLTRGGVSKIIKKLLSKSAIVSYKKEGNKKEIYFRITPLGEKVYEAHEKIHTFCYCSDVDYFKKIDDCSLKIIKDFLKNYLGHLKLRSKETEERI